MLNNKNIDNSEKGIPVSINSEAQQGDFLRSPLPQQENLVGNPESKTRGILNTNKREAIIQAALKLFSENGFQGTSTNSISKEANVATGTLFFYFASKDELINKLYLESKEEYSLFIQNDLTKIPEFKDQLKYLWDKSIEWALDNPLKYKFMIQFSSSPFISKITKQESLAGFSFLKNIFLNSLKNLDLSEDDKLFILNLFLGYNRSAISYFIDNSSSKKIHSWSEKSFNIFWDGFNK